MPMIVQRDLPVPMDDGLVLRADVFRPDAPGPVPVIMSLGFGGSGPFAHDDQADRPAARTAGITRVRTGARTPSSLLLPVIG